MHDTVARLTARAAHPQHTNLLSGIPNLPTHCPTCTYLFAHRCQTTGQRANFARR
jgi:hypothetical protein